MSDTSGGWEAVATSFATIRSDIGVDVVKRWSKSLPAAGAVIDIGCGTGMPVSKTLIADGFDVYGLDPSPMLLSAFRRRFPESKAVCETAEASRFFDRRFDGAVAIGVMFLLSQEGQHVLIERVGQALRLGGHFLFSAPRQPCTWDDSLTGRPSLSLGEERYRELLAGAGMHLVDRYTDEGSNHYFHAASSAKRSRDR